MEITICRLLLVVQTRLQGKRVDWSPRLHIFQHWLLCVKKAESKIICGLAIFCTRLPKRGTKVRVLIESYPYDSEHVLREYIILRHVWVHFCINH